MNMKDFIRIAFCVTAVAFTLSGCLPTRPITPDFDDYNIDLLKKYVKCDSTVELYSPTNVETKCLTSALVCIRKELNVVKAECEGTDYIHLANVTLSLTIRNRQGQEHGNAQTDVSECACEKWEQTSFDKFLENYKTLLQLEFFRNALKTQ